MAWPFATYRGPGPSGIGCPGRKLFPTVPSARRNGPLPSGRRSLSGDSTPARLPGPFRFFVQTPAAAQPEGPSADVAPPPAAARLARLRRRPAGAGGRPPAGHQAADGKGRLLRPHARRHREVPAARDGGLGRGPAQTLEARLLLTLGLREVR